MKLFTRKRRTKNMQKSVIGCEHDGIVCVCDCVQKYLQRWRWNARRTIDRIADALGVISLGTVLHRLRRRLLCMTNDHKSFVKVSFVNGQKWNFMNFCLILERKNDFVRQTFSVTGQTSHTCLPLAPGCDRGNSIGPLVVDMQSRSRPRKLLPWAAVDVAGRLRECHCEWRRWPLLASLQHYPTLWVLATREEQFYDNFLGERENKCWMFIIKTIFELTVDQRSQRKDFLQAKDILALGGSEIKMWKFGYYQFP